MGRIRAAGTTPRIPPGPPLPAISPASCVPCRSSRVGSSGCARAIPRRSGSIMSTPSNSRSRMNGCVKSTPVSSSATVMPLPSNRGIPSSARRPAPGCERGSRATQRTARPDRPPAHRVDTEHVLVALEQCERPSVDRCREAVERPRVDEIRHELDPLTRQPRRDLLLRCQCPGRPLPHRRLGRSAPPASAIRSAREGFLSTTIIRWPIAIAARSPSTKPRHAAAPSSAATGDWALWPPPARSATTIASPAASLRRSGRDAYASRSR